MSAPLPNTPNANNKKYKGFYQKYFIKCYLNDKLDNIIIVCYDTKDLEYKRYEIKLDIKDFQTYDKIFKLYDNIDEIYELIFQAFKSKKIISIKEKNNALTIEPLIQIDLKGQKLDFKLDIDLPISTNGDFIYDCNFILRKEIIDIEQKYSKEIEDLKSQNKMITKQLNILIEKVNELSNQSKTNINQNIKSDLENLENIELNHEIIKNLMKPNLEELNLSKMEIANISIFNKYKYKLKELKELDLSINQINSISVFKELNLNKLKILNLKYNKISIIDYLSNLSNLERIDLSHNKIEDISIFGKKDFNKLKFLNLGYNNIEDITPFGNNDLSELEELNLEFNKLNMEVNYYIKDSLSAKIKIFKI